MPAPSKSMAVLVQHTQEAEVLLQETQPLALNWLENQDLSFEKIRARGNESINSAVERSIAASTESAAQSISSEEVASITAKLQDWANKPAGQLSGEEVLYLEQQLTDLFGIEVVTVLDGNQLPHNFGVMQAAEHQKRTPEDTLANHQKYLEADLSNIRPAFGWFLPDNSAQLTTEELEAYAVSIQLQYLEQWQTSRAALKSWYKYRKVLVVNPFEQKATVAAVTSAGPSERLQYQFAGSPEVIRETAIWSPASQGKVLLFFIDDPENTVALGPVQKNT